MTPSGLSGSAYKIFIRISEDENSSSESESREAVPVKRDSWQSRDYKIDSFKTLIKKDVFKTYFLKAVVF